MVHTILYSEGVFVLYDRYRWSLSATTSQRMWALGWLGRVN